MKTLTLLMLFNYSIIDDIRHVLKQLESNNLPSSIGDHGKAFGVLQIHDIAVQDINNNYGTNYTHKQMFDPNKAEEVFNLTIRRGIELYYEKFNHYPSEQDIVRMWNGGVYTGYKNPKTEKYYLKYLKIKRDVRSSTNNIGPVEYACFRGRIHYHGSYRSEICIPEVQFYGRISQRRETVFTSLLHIPLYAYRKRRGVEREEMVFVRVYDRRRNNQNGLCGF